MSRSSEEPDVCHDQSSDRSHSEDSESEYFEDCDSDRQNAGGDQNADREELEQDVKDCTVDLREAKEPQKTEGVKAFMNFLETLFTSFVLSHVAVTVTRFFHYYNGGKDPTGDFELRLRKADFDVNYKLYYIL